VVDIHRIAYGLCGIVFLEVVSQAIPCGEFKGKVVVSDTDAIIE
jgi:hypothetical protein